MGLVFLDHEEVGQLRFLKFSLLFSLQEFLDYAMYFKNKIQQDQLIIEEDLFFRVKANYIILFH